MIWSWIWWSLVPSNPRFQWTFWLCSSQMVFADLRAQEELDGFLCGTSGASADIRCPASCCSSDQGLDSFAPLVSTHKFLPVGLEICPFRWLQVACLTEGKKRSSQSQCTWVQIWRGSRRAVRCWHRQLRELGVPHPWRQSKPGWMGPGCSN